MSTLRAAILCLMTAFGSLLGAGESRADLGTTMPISVELAGTVAANLFPVALKVSETNVFLTAPNVLFIDDKRIGLQVRLQAYDHRPDQGIALSETGRVTISGELDFDAGARQILLHQPRIDHLEFDRDSEVSRRFTREMNAAWSGQVTNPIRSAIPPHPYLLPFKDSIQDISYDGDAIQLEFGGGN